LQGANFATSTKPATGNATPPAGINTYDEYGNQTSNPQNIGTNQNYGWAGSAHRTTDKNGLILLGARIYNPTTGQFTSTDPVPGGNENAYN
jgi:RHS repeat-associated protein